ncbi:twin-arginine translocase TatA/TatE family subunit [Bacillus sp. V3-13]|uniref:twin-arginine translocase TatA/TatE family subunit n=1 Tax=Bacillus sp. V3-13 TaxID=2053728 RepID=UPI000C774C32|nr:twin-arginine translocase TatA/TatE family subunit [Bacillus sp. V3-13]PLR77936.1 twin-arginine translocase TatA/TatE family subunit [Bacillus sp. V3-13]
MTGIGASGIVIIGIVALVMFGPKKLPELGRAVGSTLKEFREGTKGIIEDQDSKEGILIKKDVNK